MSEQYEIVEKLKKREEPQVFRDSLGISNSRGRYTTSMHQEDQQAASLIQAMGEALEPFAERANEIEAYGKRSDHSTAAVELGALRLARSVLALLKGRGT